MEIQFDWLLKKVMNYSNSNPFQIIHIDKCRKYNSNYMNIQYKLKTKILN